jgi:hypothetical protein
MKYLVLILAVFLLLDSPTLAQETIPEPQDLKEFPNWVVAQKPVICGPVKEVMDKVKEFGEESISAWVDAEQKSVVMSYINETTGTATVLEIQGKWACILSQGVGGTLLSLPKKIKGIPIKHLTF